MRSDELAKRQRQLADLAPRVAAGKSLRGRAHRAVQRLRGFAINFWQGFTSMLQPRSCFGGCITPLLYQNF